MNRVSKSRAKQLKEYGKLKREFLREHDECFVCGEKLLYAMRDLHHIHGRTGRLLTFIPGFRCVCRECHYEIHNNPVEAQRASLLGPDGTWNDFRRAQAWHNQRTTNNEPRREEAYRPAQAVGQGSAVHP